MATMRLFSFSGRNKRVSGTIGYFGLEDWWFSAFSGEERQHIEEKFQPLAPSGSSLTSGVITYSSQSDVAFLTSLAGWFTRSEDRAIAYKILEKAEELAQTRKRVLDVHFLYGEKIAIYYKGREDPAALRKAIDACRQQISIAKEAARAFVAEYGSRPLPGHKGYEQLAIILEKQMNFEEVIDLCAQAAKQGWAGDWERRIERCKRKLTNKR